jgi:hypothetical protein
LRVFVFRCESGTHASQVSRHARSIAPRVPIDPIFVTATVRLARRGLTNAEIERALQAMTGPVGKPAPSYSAVRRIAGEAREPASPNAYVEEIVTKLLMGRFPDLYRAELEHARRSAGRGPFAL